MTEAARPQSWNEGYFTSQDGLRLYARHYPAAAHGNRPVLCLAGLTRNSKDFHKLAEYLSGQVSAPRDVYCLDYRGRGRSDRDGNWRNYIPYIELLDALDFMTVAGLHDAAVIGTSRGGIIAMLMAVMRPAAIGAVVLNDIGPVIETAGLARIMGYVGKTPVPASWDDAADIARTMNASAFTDITEEEWRQVARQWFTEKDGRPVPDYDRKLGKVVAQLNLPDAAPDMWPQFDALASIPTLVLRGENSDLLSAATVEEMGARHPGLEVHVVEGQGHAPLLCDARSLSVIAEFLAGGD